LASARSKRNSPLIRLKVRHRDAFYRLLRKFQTPFNSEQLLAGSPPKNEAGALLAVIRNLDWTPFKVSSAVKTAWFCARHRYKPFVALE
jgi:hypothetical protein